MSPRDGEAVLALADRLTIGVAPWRSPDLVLDAVRNWVSGALQSLDDESTDRALFVAVDVDDDIVGFVSVGEDMHWSGELDAYIGELVVRPDRERRGIGRQLVRAAEEWAVANGLRRIRLSTGAANHAALQLYDGIGFRREDVTLSKSVAGVSDSSRRASAVVDRN